MLVNDRLRESGINHWLYPLYHKYANSSITFQNPPDFSVDKNENTAEILKDPSAVFQFYVI